jgi:hypothetical protein
MSRLETEVKPEWKEGTPTARVVKPYPETHASLVWTWLKEWENCTLDDSSPRSAEELAKKFQSDVSLGMRSYALIGTDGIPVGAIWFDAVGDDIFMGHLAFSKIGLTPSIRIWATQIALSDMFSSGARKIVWAVLPHNRMFINFLLKRIRAGLEGILRKQTRCNGKLTDVVMLASFPAEVT